MSKLSIIFAHKTSKALDEKIMIERHTDGFHILFQYPNAKEDGTHKNKFVLPSQTALLEYVTNVLVLAIHDCDPFRAIQFFFPMTPSSFLTIEKLKEDDVWNTVLRNLHFWVRQASWPQPPISPILAPLETTTDNFLDDKFDLTEADFTIEYSPCVNARSVSKKPNHHIYFDKHGRQCSRFQVAK